MNKHWLVLWGAMGLAACQTPVPAPNALILPETQHQANATSTEQWYQAEWFWQGRSIAFLTMLRPDSDGSTVLLATTLSGNELFALKHQNGHFTVLQQQPETKRIPLPYVYRDVAWLHASPQAFQTMQAPLQVFSATPTTRQWQDRGHVVWQAQWQSDGSWLVSNIAAHYQLRLTPLHPPQEFVP